MGRFVLLVCIFSRVTTISPAQTITEIFGTGANAFTMDFVTIGNPGNAPNIWGGGSVSYVYNLGKYEISRDMVDKATSQGLTGVTIAPIADVRNFGGADGSSRPATGITWYEAAKFVNWLNTSKGFMPAYKFNANGGFSIWAEGDNGYDSNNKTRNSLANFWIPNTNEFYKAARGSPNGTWYEYATGSNTQPTPVSGGTSANTAVYYSQQGPADITNAGGLSAWGTMGQQGNVSEWREDVYTNIYTGASERFEDLDNWNNWELNTAAFAPPDFESVKLGFRVALAAIPEPSSLSLLALGGVVVMVVGIRRRS
jgi:hypothetical protein